MVDFAARRGTELQNHRRHFSNQNDYHASFGAWRWDDLAQAHAELGRLRLDSFLFDTVVLTDSQFLHSRPIANLVSTGRFDRLPHIEIRSRRGTLEDTLLAFALGRDQSRPLAGHWFPAVDPDGAVHRDIQSSHGRLDVASWRDIPCALARAGADKDGTERLEQFWAHAIEAAERGMLTVRAWEAPHGFDFSKVFRQLVGQTVDGVVGAIRHPDVIPVLRGILAETLDSRADTISTLQKVKATADGDARVELNTIESWYNYCYNETLCIQHHCGTKDYFDREPCRSYLPLYDEHDSAAANGAKVERVEVPENFMLALASLKNTSFDAVADGSGQNLTEWYDNADRSHLRRATDKLIEKVEQEVGFDHPNPVLGRVETAAKYIGQYAPASPAVMLGAAAGGLAAQQVGLWFGTPVEQFAIAATAGAMASKAVEEGVKNFVASSGALAGLAIGKRSIVSKAIIAKVPPDGSRRILART